MLCLAQVALTPLACASFSIPMICSSLNLLFISFCSFYLSRTTLFNCPAFGGQATSSYRECGPPGLVYREIADSTLDLSVGLAWKRGTAKAVVTNFVRVVRDMSVPPHS